MGMMSDSDRMWVRIGQASLVVTLLGGAFFLWDRVYQPSPIVAWGRSFEYTYPRFLQEHFLGLANDAEVTRGSFLRYGAEGGDLVDTLALSDRAELFRGAF